MRGKLLLVSDMLSGSLSKLFEDHSTVASSNMSEKLQVSPAGTVLFLFFFSLDCLFLFFFN